MKKLILMLALSVLLALTLTLMVGAVSVTDDGSLILGECVIEGVDPAIIPNPTRGLVYSLDDEAMTASVSGRGSFSGGDLVFPSSVTYEGQTYVVTRIGSNLFQRLTYDLYVPDTVTFIGGGSGVGTFGNSTINRIYIGSGLNGFERETFSGSKGFSTFVCKSKVTYVDTYAFNSISLVGTREAYELDLSSVVRFEALAFSNSKLISTVEFGECLEYIGSEAFVNCSNMNGSVVIPADCTLSYRCFNGTSLEQVVIRVNEGEAKVMPVEMFSGASGDLVIIFDGYATVQNYFFTGNSGTLVYMPSYAHIEMLVNSNVGKSGSDRINNSRIGKVYFYSCEDGLVYSATNAGVITCEGEAEAKHVYTAEPVLFPANCSQYERYSYVCYSCGAESVVSEGDTLASHVFKKTVKASSCQSIGYTEYLCTVCGLCEVAHYEDAESHGTGVVSYEAKDYKTLTATVSCEFCDKVTDTYDISLVNKCYIEGYGLFDATMQYVSVDKDGNLTPSDTTFNRAIIYFPSCVEIDGEIVEVKTIGGFKSKSIKAIYVPDSVTRIKGGSGTGCFSHTLDMKSIVVGKGITALEAEVFAMSAYVSLDTFIFKGVITELQTICLQKVCASNADIPYEFNTALTYVGKQVNFNGTILREASLVKDCNLSEKFAFNNANGLKTVYIEGGDTPETAIDLGQEMMSNTATVNMYIKGYVTVSGQAVLSGQPGMRIYMSNTEAIDLFAAAIKKQGYSERINKATFMDCATGTAWYVANNAERVQHPSVAFAHGGVTTEVDSTCTSLGSSVDSCFVCGEVISTRETEMKAHRYDSGVITVMPSAQSCGVITYTCLDCGTSQEAEIAKVLGNHVESVTVIYNNGFASKGYTYVTCVLCDYTRSSETAPVVIILGYSVNMEGTGVTCGYKIDRASLEYYESYMGKVEFGFIIANANDAEANGLVDGEHKLLAQNRGMQVSMTKTKYDYLEIKITGAETEQAKSIDLLIALYLIADMDSDGDTDISFVQHSMADGNDCPITSDGISFNTISIKRAVESLQAK